LVVAMQRCSTVVRETVSVPENTRKKHWLWMPKNLHDLCTTSCFLCLPSPVTQRSHLLGSCTIVASPKIRGGTKCSILGEQHYFVWDTASQRTKWLCSKNFGGSWPPRPTLATPVGSCKGCCVCLSIFLRVQRKH